MFSTCCEYFSNSWFVLFMLHLRSCFAMLALKYLVKYIVLFFCGFWVRCIFVYTNRLWKYAKFSEDFIHVFWKCPREQNIKISLDGDAHQKLWPFTQWMCKQSTDEWILGDLHSLGLKEKIFNFLDDRIKIQSYNQSDIQIWNLKLISEIFKCVYAFNFCVLGYIYTCMHEHAYILIYIQVYKDKWKTWIQILLYIIIRTNFVIGAQFIV